MDKLRIFLIFAVCLGLLAIDVLAAGPSSDDKCPSNAIIDPALQKQLDSGKDEEISVIVIAKGDYLPNLSNFDIREIICRICPILI